MLYPRWIKFFKKITVKSALSSSVGRYRLSQIPFWFLFLCLSPLQSAEQMPPKEMTPKEQIVGKQISFYSLTEKILYKMNKINGFHLLKGPKIIQSESEGLKIVWILGALSALKINKTSILPIFYLNKCGDNRLIDFYRNLPEWDPKQNSYNFPGPKLSFKIPLHEQNSLTLEDLSIPELNLCIQCLLYEISKVNLINDGLPRLENLNYEHYRNITDETLYFQLFKKTEAQQNLKKELLNFLPKDIKNIKEEIQNQKINFFPTADVLMGIKTIKQFIKDNFHLYEIGMNLIKKNPALLKNLQTKTLPEAFKIIYKQGIKRSELIEYLEILAQKETILKKIIDYHKETEKYWETKRVYELTTSYFHILNNPHDFNDNERKQWIMKAFTVLKEFNDQLESYYFGPLYKNNAYGYPYWNQEENCFEFSEEFTFLMGDTPSLFDAEPVNLHSSKDDFVDNFLIKTLLTQIIKQQQQLLLWKKIDLLEVSSQLLLPEKNQETALENLFLTYLKNKELQNSIEEKTQLFLKVKKTTLYDQDIKTKKFIFPPRIPLDCHIGIISVLKTLHKSDKIAAINTLKAYSDPEIIPLTKALLTHQNERLINFLIYLRRAIDIENILEKVTNRTPHTTSKIERKFKNESQLKLHEKLIQSRNQKQQIIKETVKPESPLANTPAHLIFPDAPAEKKRKKPLNNPLPVKQKSLISPKDKKEEPSLKDTIELVNIGGKTAIVAPSEPYIPSPKKSIVSPKQGDNLPAKKTTSPSRDSFRNEPQTLKPPHKNIPISKTTDDIQPKTPPRPSSVQPGKSWVSVVQPQKTTSPQMETPSIGSTKLTKEPVREKTLPQENPTYKTQSFTVPTNNFTMGGEFVPHRFILKDGSLLQVGTKNPYEICLSIHEMEKQNSESPKIKTPPIPCVKRRHSF